MTRVVVPLIVFVLSMLSSSALFAQKPGEIITLPIPYLTGLSGDGRIAVGTQGTGEAWRWSESDGYMKFLPGRQQKGRCSWKPNIVAPQEFGFPTFLSRSLNISGVRDGFELVRWAQGSFEDGLPNGRMHAFRLVHRLRHMQVGCQGAQDIRILSC